MGDARLLADDNVEILRQGVELIQALDDQLFGEGAPGAERDGVGRQFRHVIDFYRCFLAGLDAGTVDYTTRQRDPRVERDRTFAVQALESLVERFRDDRISVDRALRVRLERVERPEAPGDAWGESSVARELGFLLSHTVHHYALIKWILRAQDFRVPEGFGVAPSTLKYWKEGSPLKG